MKVLFAIKALDVPGGGAERVLSIVASGLAERGHDVAAVTFDRPGGESFYPMDSRVRRVALGIGLADQKTGAGAFFKRLPALRRTVRGERPDVAVGFMHSMFAPLAFSMVGTGIPLVASEHIVPEYYRGRRAEYALFAMGCLLAKRVTVLSESVRRLYPAFLQNRMVPMPNPVTVYENCVADVVGEDRAQKVVLSVGRLEAQKDHATLIRAFAGIADRFPDWRVRIVGDGSLRGELKGLILELGLEERVTLAGATDRIDRVYASAQLLATPSRFESFGMATAEAMAVGLPALGFADCPGTNELVEHDRSGWLVAPNEGGDRVSAYARGLSTLMGDAQLRRRLGETARKDMSEFDSPGVIQSWEVLLSEFAGGVS